MPLLYYYYVLLLGFEYWLTSSAHLPYSSFRVGCQTNEAVAICGIDITDFDVTIWYISGPLLGERNRYKNQKSKSIKDLHFVFIGSTVLYQ